MEFFCDIFTHFVVKQALFDMAGGVFKFRHRKNQFLLFIYNASYGIWVKGFPRLCLFKGFEKRVLTLTLT